MLRPLVLVPLAALAPTVAAQDIASGTFASLTSEALNLFADTNLVTVNAVAFTADSVTITCGGTAEAVQFGVARGFLGANGFVISNAWVGNQDESDPPAAMTDDPSGCANSQGTVGDLPTPGDCDGVDFALTSALLDPGFAPVATQDAAFATFAIDCAVDTTLDLSYSLTTYENPVDTTYYDSFAIFLDGTLLAGGTTNGTPPAGTDPWTLSPTSTAPYEFNSLPTNTIFFNVPAVSTGLRTISVAVPAGSHALSFHVADGASLISEPICNSADDDVVDTTLFFGLETFQSGDAGAVTPGLAIGRSGHPTVAGGPFGNDLQVTLDGAPAGAILLLLQGPSSAPGFTIPLLAPNQILLDLTSFQVLTAQVASGTGSDVYPPVPPTIPVGVAGSRFHYQWWAVTGAGIQNSKGLVMSF